MKTKNPYKIEINSLFPKDSQDEHRKKQRHVYNYLRKAKKFSKEEALKIMKENKIV